MTESKYYILYNDNTTSKPYSLYELSCTEEITEHTLIIKDNEEPKPAGAFIDFTDNRQTPLPEELNTFNIGAYAFSGFWAYNHFPKYKIYWGIGILVFLLLVILNKNPSTNLKNLLPINMEYLFLPLIKTIGIAGQLMAALYLVKGNEMAWRNRKFKNIEEFKAVQKAWFTWIWVSLVCGLIILFLFSYSINN